MVAVLEIGAFSEQDFSLVITTSFQLAKLGPHADGLSFPVTSLLAAHLADNYGRRLTLRIGAMIFTIGGAVQTFCNGYAMMVVGRVISGFGVGMLR